VGGRGDLASCRRERLLNLLSRLLHHETLASNLWVANSYFDERLSNKLVWLVTQR
jgi:hypothetical protein